MAENLRNKWLWVSAGDLETELVQCAEEGREIPAALKSRIRRLAARLKRADNERLQAAAGEILDETVRLRIRKGYEYTEPSDLGSIRRLRPRGPRVYKQRLSDAVVKDRIHGAWLGRCAGCLLGKPVEGVRTDKMWPFLKATGQWPVSGYLKFSTFGPKVKREHPEMVRRAWAEQWNYMPVDDDTNYTTTGLLVVEKSGPDFTPADVAQFWMGNIPVLSTCTAERVAYRNFLIRLEPPAGAAYRNPYREWIGAQIRADAFGYVNVGNPQQAAEFAWRDACISHVKNGIYGEMFVAAMLAAAPYCDSPEEIVTVGLSEIPKRSRLYAHVTTAVRWRRSGMSYDEAVDAVHKRWNEHSAHDWCHTNSNAVICVVALLYGDGDAGRAMCMAVQPGFDTDCNGATVGSITGMVAGAKKFPQKWSGRLNDTLHTSLSGSNVVKISEMAERTFRVWKTIRRGRG